MAPANPTLAQDNILTANKVLDFDAAAAEIEEQVKTANIGNIPSPLRSRGAKPPRLSASFDVIAAAPEDDDPEVVAVAQIAAKAHAENVKLWEALASSEGVTAEVLEDLRRMDALARFQAAAQIEQQRQDAFWELLRSQLNLDVVELVARNANGGVVPVRVARQLFEAGGSTPSSAAAQSRHGSVGASRRRSSSASSIVGDKSAEQSSSRNDTAASGRGAGCRVAPFAGLSKDGSTVVPSAPKCGTPQRTTRNRSRAGYSAAPEIAPNQEPQASTCLRGLGNLPRPRASCTNSSEQSASESCVSGLEHSPITPTRAIRNPPQRRASFAREDSPSVRERIAALQVRALEK